MKLKKIHVIIIGGIAAVVLILGIIGALFYNGILLFNYPSKEKYPVRGVDVSSYQGDIDWQILSKEDIKFAYIKATEGSSYVDPNFEKNYMGAMETDLRVGAYHFFSFESSGQTQADNFCKMVPKSESMMPPVVDVEYYNMKGKELPEAAKIKEELKIMLTALEKQYGRKPVIYVTKESYNAYISGEFTEYDIWFRDIFSTPSLKDGREWTFWQYTNRDRLKGYTGREKYIDVNVFHGTEEMFLQY